MALKLLRKRIVGTIDNLEEKLNGKIPINRLELLYLVNSWGRNKEFCTNDNIKILQCKSKECYNLSKLDTSEITNMSQLFQWSEFNGDISNWDVSSVTNMNKMFYLAKKFNQPLNNWDVSSVTNMGGMFFLAKKFNQPLNNWNVSNVTDMNGMFNHALKFNQPLNNWNVSNVRNMNFMFGYASNFNQALNDWDVSSVTDIGGMFIGAESFNQPILWDLSNVQHALDVFYDAIAFEKRFNNGNPLPKETNKLKFWFNNNRDKMLAIEIKERNKTI